MSQYERERNIFEACLGLDPGQRASYLKETCADDPVLSDRVLALLAAHERAGSALGEVSTPRLPLDTPKEIGPYRIVQVLGEGGMGIVYEAEQRVPIRRMVALKVIRQDLATGKMAARLEAERQAMAVMSHPGIAKIFDAGVAPTGQPYFAMELVRGLPVTRYCDRHQLSTRARLRLFVGLCHAVHHAHQKGIIHRDLKPSNVLVAEQDGNPLPRVIDFGIAKAMGKPLTDSSTVTLHGQAIGTPAYMSPEQADSSGIDIDTRSDIYSLGIMLYELLVGQLPVNPDEVGLLRHLSQLASWEKEHPTPSSMLAFLGNKGQTISKLRSTDPTTLARDLRGDLDWIVSKAIEKDRSRRYQAVSELADDVGRFLNDEPILARPPSATYRFRKLVRRHRTAVVAGSVVLLALLIGTIGLGVGLWRQLRAERLAVREAERAAGAEREATKRLRESLLAQARANRRTNRPGRRYRSLEILAQASAIQPGPELRDEAVAALALSDLRTITEWQEPNALGVVFDPSHRMYTTRFQGGRVEIRRLGETVSWRTLPGFGPYPWVATFSPDSRFLAVKYHDSRPSDNPALRVWDLESGQAILSSSESINGSAMDFDPATRLFVTASEEGWIQIRQIPGGRLRTRFRPQSPARMVQFRPDGKAVACACENGDVELYDLDGRLIARLSKPSLAFTVDWSPDGRYLAAGYENKVAVVWDVAARREVATLRGHQAEVVEVHYSPRDPLVITQSWDQSSRLWDAMTGEELLVMDADATGFSSDGRTVAFVTNRTVGLWEVLYGDTFRSLSAHTGKNPLDIDVAPDGRRFLSAGQDGTLVWDVQTEKVVSAFPGFPARDAYFDPQSDRLVVCGSSGIGRVDLVSAGRAPAESSVVRMIPGACESAGVDALGTLVAFAQGTAIRLFNPGLDREILSFDAYPGLSRLSVSPGGRWIAGGNWKGDHVKVWDAQTGAVAVDLLPGQDSVNVLFEPRGRWLITGSGRDYRVFSVPSWREVHRFERPSKLSSLPGIQAVARDGSLLAVVMDDRSIQLYTLETGEPYLRLEAPGSMTFTSVQFHPDRSKLYASNHGNRILIWEILRIRKLLEGIGLTEAKS